MVNVILDEGLHDEAFIKEQTDLPFLVRDDNGRFLRECDMEEDGSDEDFYYWNEATDSLGVAAGTWGSDVMTLALDDDELPALTGSHLVKLADGTKVRVRPVFEHL